jgi:glyoxylase-like metal-dependent hydrolase (beta-lactamase superfamily II)
MKIAPGIHRIGENSMINAYLVEQAGEVTIIDAGVPGYYNDIDRELAAMGRTPADVRALILTHGHSDHIGFAERLRRERRIPVSVHEADAALARGEVPNPAKGYGPVKLGPLLASCGSPSCTVGCARPSCSRSRPSATGQPWTSREARGSS